MKKLTKLIGEGAMYGVMAFFLGCFLAFFAVLVVLAAGAIFSIIGG